MKGYFEIYSASVMIIRLFPLGIEGKKSINNQQLKALKVNSQFQNTDKMQPLSKVKLVLLVFLLCLFDINGQDVKPEANTMQTFLGNTISKIDFSLELKCGYHYFY